MYSIEKKIAINKTPSVENEGYDIDIYFPQSIDSVDYKPVWTINTAKNSGAKIYR